MRPRHLLIEGRVQGIGYRDWLVREASAQGLAGWVRNLPDGRVEAVVAGPEPAVMALLTACRRGPRLARVDRIEEAFWEGEVALEEGFQRR